MKNVFVLYVMLVFTSFTYSQINRESAYEILKNDLLGENWYNNEIYASKTVLQGQTLIFTNDTFVYSPNNTSWFFFVDEYPNADWWHPCKYVFINNLNGSIHFVQMTSPPYYDSLDALNPIFIGNSNISTDDFFNIDKMEVSSTNANGYAIILSGGYEQLQNYPRYYNHCKAIYQTLINVYNFDRNNIYVIMADGTDPADDYNSWGHWSRNIPCSFPCDLDGDGMDDIQYSATKQNLSLVFNTLQNRITNQDNVFIFVTDHGDVGSKICLWNKTLMSTSEFAQEVNKLNCAKTVNLCMVQCFGGGYTTALKGHNRVVSTACSATEVALTRTQTQHLYSEFCYHWLSAVTGLTPDNGVVVNADFNNDGHTSIEEAFLYARNHDTWYNLPVSDYNHETPQYYSNKACLGASMDFNGVFDYSCFGYDLYTRDNYSDDGSEPLFDPRDGTNNSPDIWLRNYQDGDTVHQRMVMGTNYLYVKIRNRSTSTDTSWYTDSIRIYARPTFLHGHYFNPANWTELCKAELPRIAPGKDTTIIIPVNNQDLNVMNTQYALYSRIESPYDILSSPETNTIGYNVIDNNNISLKNVLITNMMISQNNFGLDANFAVTSEPSSLTSSKLRFDLSTGTSNILDNAEVTLIFPEDLMTDWTPASENIKQLTANTFLVTGETVEISGVPETDVTLRYNFLTRRNTSNDIIKNHITQYVGDVEELVGSLTIQVEKPVRAATNLFTANAGNDTAILIGTNAALHATQINEDATYRWYDKQRNFKYEGLSYTVTPSETSEYILEVTAESDGYRDLDTVKVNVVPGCIRSITPNPVSDNWVTVSYEYATMVTSAHLYIYNTGTTTLVGSYDLSNLGNVSSLDVEVTNYPTGSYTVVLVCDNAVCHSKVLIRQ